MKKNTNFGIDWSDDDQVNLCAIYKNTPEFYKNLNIICNENAYGKYQLIRSLNSTKLIICEIYLYAKILQNYNPNSS